MASFNASTSAIAGLLDCPLKALSSNASTNSLPSMDSDFGATQSHLLNQRIDDLIRNEGQGGDFTRNEAYSESGIGSNAGSACPSRKTSGVSEGVIIDQGSDSQVESPSDSPLSVQTEGQQESQEPVLARQESMPESPKATPEAAQQRTRKLSRFLVSPVILPDNTVAEKLPDLVKPQEVPSVPSEPTSQTVQQIQQAVTLQQEQQQQYANETVIQTVQYQQVPPQPAPVGIETEKGETQKVMVNDPLWLQDQQHALINQQLQQAMGLTPSQPSTVTQMSQAPSQVPVELSQITAQNSMILDPQVLEYHQQLMVDPQLLQLQQFHAQQMELQRLMQENAPPSRDAMDSLPSGTSSQMKLPETLEQLQKELENITHAHVTTKKESAPTTQNTSIAEPNPIPIDAVIEGECLDLQYDPNRQLTEGYVISQAELLQQQIQGYDNTSSISEITTSGGPLSRDDTSVCNSRRTSADLNIDYVQAQAQMLQGETGLGGIVTQGSGQLAGIDLGDGNNLQHQSSTEKSDR